MNRKELIIRICNEVLKEDKLPIYYMENRSKCHGDKYKSGLYFLYNNVNECIYIGKVGNGETASLYMRMVGNGNGSHKINDIRWYSQVTYGYWHKFSLADDELSILERLAIIGMDQPIYNDNDTDQAIIDSMCKKLGF